MTLNRFEYCIELLGSHISTRFKKVVISLLVNLTLTADSVANK